MKAMGSSRLTLAVLAILSVVGVVPADPGFNRDVRPILSDACFPCHGPDAARRKAGLRLDTEDGVRAVLAIEKQSPNELLRRITSTDPTQRMPPPKSGPALKPAQVETIRQWVNQGARWEKHWAFLPPKRPATPRVHSPGWLRQGLDAFILARLETERLTPAPEADRTTLLRRVTLDLTGLPPTPEDLAAFQSDHSPDAYEKVVERLLASPRFGERLAARWLDAARYADTNGYQTDGPREMWRWRDWVLEAFNANMPFDRFTVEQLAGDLLPQASIDQRVATGFHRNHRGNSEGGIIPEEYQVEYVADRVETTATVWLGLTVGCARCHDHKYDPFSQKDFYQFFAYFNGIPEQGRALKYGNSPPLVRAPTRDDRERLERLEAALNRAESLYAAQTKDLTTAQARWEAEGPHREDWAPTRSLVGHFPQQGVILRGAAIPVSSERGRPRLDLRSGGFAEAGEVGNFGFYDKFSLSLWFQARAASSGTLVSRMTDVDQGDGYGVGLHDGHVRVHLTKRWLDDALRVETERPLVAGRWYHLAVTCDGSRTAAGIRIFVDGHLVPVRILLDELNQPFSTKEPFRIGAGGGQKSRFEGQIEEVRLYHDVLEEHEIQSLSMRETVAHMAALPRTLRTPAQEAKLRGCFLERHAPQTLRAAHMEVERLRRQRAALIESFPTVMVMEEMPRPRPTFVLLRGQYDRPGERVGPGVPGVLGTLPPGGSNSRLGLAQWLVSPNHPLTARVTVNRAWQALFGAGLVRTAEDFGAQGEPPTHPELLDWLATEFVRSGWDIKELYRRLVTSALYRQSSRLTEEGVRRDPDNRLLARMPRLRLSAEAIRDQALAVSGLLAERLGGPSVRPYQPGGLWKELTGTEEYVPDSGEALYRRSLYTYWKRTAAPPALATFDAAGRETCTVREVRTNTPLQALNLMNDVTFVEAARVLAERALFEELSPEARLRRLFVRVLAREPRSEELHVLRQGIEAQRSRFLANPEQAHALLRVGERRPDPRLNPVDVATHATIAALLLNLDETVTRE